MSLNARAVPRFLWRWKKSVAVVVLALALYCSRYAVLRSLGSFLDVTRPLASPVDYVMILGGGHDTRPFVAAALMKTGWARGALVPTVRHEADSELSEHDIIQRVLQARGAAPGAITVVPADAASTADEAAALKTFLDAAPTATVAVVTNPSHSRRARWIFQRTLGERAEQVQFVAAPANGVDEAAWWKTERGSVSYLSEFPKMAYYWLSY